MTLRSSRHQRTLSFEGASGCEPRPLLSFSCLSHLLTSSEMSTSRIPSFIDAEKRLPMIDSGSS